jgi:hypothetical protein
MIARVPQPKPKPRASAEAESQREAPPAPEPRAKPEGARDMLGEWRGVMESVLSSAASAAGRADIPNELLGAMQRQVELVQEVVERERRAQSDIASRLLGPVDAVFDLLEESGATIRAQAEALESAGRALEESAGMMKRQAETFERAIATLRQPVELAKGSAARRRARPAKPAHVDDPPQPD